MKHFLRSFVPRWLVTAYHTFLAVTGAWWYGYPSRKMLVIGVTGTTGKSTVVEFLASIFRAAGHKVGVASTIRFQVADKTWLNNLKMTMPGRWQLQHLLHRMVNAKCSVTIIETTSEGIKQRRHLGLDYDCAVFTNLMPEHIESHGSFAAYREAKGKLFARLSRTHRKKNIPKVSVINMDSSDAHYFLQFSADHKVGYRTSADTSLDQAELVLRAEEITTTGKESRFVVNGSDYTVHLPGEYNVVNALAAITVALEYSIPVSAIQSGIASVTSVPGRFEFVTVGTPFDVVVDYAHEPAGLKAVYKATRALHSHRIIAVLGAAGGGRDKWKRSALGKIAAQYADVVIVTNEDPYDEEPRFIIRQVADGAAEAGKKEGETLYSILDRKEAIRKALSLARPHDLVLITGKGSEQSMVVKGGKKIPWSDKQVVRELTAPARFASGPSSN